MGLEERSDNVGPLWPILGLLRTGVASTFVRPPLPLLPGTIKECTGLGYPLDGPTTDEQVSTKYLRPFAPKATKRYQRTARVTYANVIIPKAWRHPDLSGLASGWREYIHPEGQVYFVNNEMRVVTESWIYDEDSLHAIGLAFKEVRALAEKSNVTIASNMDVCLFYDEEESHCTYYLADYEARSIFWLEDVENEAVGIPAMVIDSHDKHFQLTLEEQFWVHAETFCSHRDLPAGAEDELRHVMIHATCDLVTSSLSTYPFTEAHSMRSLKLLREPGRSCHKTWVIARLWSNILSSRIINFYGTKVSRLSRNQRRWDGFVIFEALETHHWKRLLSGLLFNKPAENLKALNALWVDRVSYSQHWEIFILGLLAEWKQDMLLGSVFFLGNIILKAFSANGLQPSLFSGLFVLLNSIATALGIGSIVSAMVLQIKHAKLSRLGAAEAATYMMHCEGATHGFLSLSLILSIPQATLLWSIVVTVASLTIVSLDATTQWVAISSAIVQGLLAILPLVIAAFYNHMPMISA